MPRLPGCVLGLLLAAGVVRADAPLVWHSALEVTGVTAQAPAQTAAPAPDSAELLTRLRLTGEWKPSDLLNGEVAYEQQGQLSTAALPPAFITPYRVAPLAGALIDGDSLRYRQELDRAFLTWQRPRGEVTVGRQAVGLGRGLLFSAVDVFAPFSPLEIDRQWRPGVDGITADMRLGSTASLGEVAILGENPVDDSFILRARGFQQGIDAEVLAGKHAEDLLTAAVVSAPVGQMETHAEAAFFRIPDAQAAHVPGWHPVIPKATLGGSYQANIGNGLYLLAEYHYSGFGGGTPAEIAALEKNPAFLTRLARGDMQIAGRQAVGTQASYPLDAARTVSLTAVASPRDGSAVLIPTLTCNPTDHTTWLVSLYLPNGSAHSEYGATPLSAFAQWRLYW